MEGKEIDMKSCRICLTTKKPLCPLFRYKLSGNYAEMLTAIADVKVASNDGLPDKICTKCSVSLEKAFLLKTIAERSDRKLRKIQAKSIKHATTKKIVFDSFTEVKSELAPINNSKVKNEPIWEMEIENLDKPIETIDGKDLVIANTVIRKVEPNVEETGNKSIDGKYVETDELTRSSPRIAANQPTTQSADFDTEYLEDDIFQDDDDADYVPPEEVSKPVKLKKFKKPKLGDIRVFKDKKIVRRLKVMKNNGGEEKLESRGEGKSKSTTITCYPILKNGTRGAPILLKRPKDATILKFHPNYKRSTDGRSSSKDKPIRMVKNPKAADGPKQKEKLVCPICGILTYTLGNHMATHEEKKKYTCTQCNKSFAQKGNLFVHMKQHTGVKDHICEVCGAGFYSQKSLVRHNLIHKGERPFACNLCTKKFIARCDLTRHLKIHSGYKPFKCAICTMSFNAKHQLQNHERMHTGERPYECQKQSLNRHMHTHSGEKKFVCDICNKRFVQNHHLTNHLLVHTGDRPYACEVCNVAFSYKVNLNNHVYKVHGINLKFKSIHIVTEEILRKEIGMASEARTASAISHIMPQSHVGEVPNPGAHETVSHMTDYKHEEVHIPSDYSV